MAIFGRNPDVDAVPQEVRDYYQSERRERTGVAWLLALATLAVTLVLAVGLYWGGRWVYRSLTHKKTSIATQTTPTTTSQGEVGSTGASTTTTPTSTTSNNSGSATSSTTTTSTPAATTPVTTQTTPTTTSTTSTSQTSTTKLVNTGPGDVLGTFMLVTIAGALMHRLVLAPRRSGL